MSMWNIAGMHLKYGFKSGCMYVKFFPSPMCGVVSISEESQEKKDPGIVPTLIN